MLSLTDSKESIGLGRIFLEKNNENWWEYVNFLTGSQFLWKIKS